MGFQEMTYKYFFGSDNRSIPYLNTLLENYDSIKVVTTEPRNTGRGRKILNNPVEDCLLYTSPSPRDPWKSRMPSSA